MITELRTDPFPHRSLFSPPSPNFSIGSPRPPFLGADRLSIFCEESDRFHLTADLNYRTAQSEFDSRPEDSRALFLLSAQAGHPDAQFAVGVMQRLGDGGNPQRYSGERWLRRAAKNGHSRATYCCGLSLVRGPEVAEAYRAIRRSAEGGYDEAMYAYGRALLAGEPVGKDEKRAFRLFKAASAKGNLRALFWEAVCLHDGIGVRPDAAKAVDLLQRAGDNGLVEARDALKMIMKERWKKVETQATN
jgi:TPR repeat protein